MLFNLVCPAFQGLKADVLGISVDGLWCHEAFAMQQKHFPVLADFKPKDAVSRAYVASAEAAGIRVRSFWYSLVGGWWLRQKRSWSSDGDFVNGIDRTQSRSTRRVSLARTA